MNVQDVKTPEDLEEWVRQRAANIVTSIVFADPSNDIIRGGQS